MSSRWIRALVAAFLVVTVAPAAFGELSPVDKVCGRGGEVVKLVLARALPAGSGAAPAGRPASAFKPATDRVAVRRMAELISGAAEERATLEGLFTSALAGYEQGVGGSDLANDVAGAIAVLVATRQSLATGKEMGQPEIERVARQIRAALEVQEVRELSDADRQGVYEWAIGTSALLLALHQASATSAPGGAAAEAGRLLGDLFGADPASISVKDGALEVRRPAGPPGHLTAGVFPELPGWRESRPDGVRTLCLEINEFGAPERYVLQVLSPRPRGASVEAGFDVVWREVILAGFEARGRPLPLKRRLKGGFECAFDTLDLRSRADGRAVSIGLFIVDSGASFVPVVLILAGFRDQVTRDVETFLDGFRAGPAPPPEPLFDPRALAGTWRAGGNSFADLVDAATGNYVADAGIAWGETLRLGEDGTYASDFASVSGGRVLRVHETGRYALRDDLLTFTPAGNSEDARPRTYRVYGLRDTADGKGRVLALSVDGTVPVPFTARSTAPFSAGWYRRQAE